MVDPVPSYCVLYFAILGSAVCSIGFCCGTNQNRIVGLFQPSSYQDRAVQLAYRKRTSQVCFEPFKSFSANAPDHEVWEDVCRLLSGSVVGLIADQPLPTALKDVIDTVQFPVVSSSTITTDSNSTIISVAPSEEQLANALSTLILYNSWTNVILLTWQGSGIELFMPDTSRSYRVSAVYYIDTGSDAVVRSKLSKIQQNDVPIIILHHYNLDEVLQIFKMAVEENLHKYPYKWILLGRTTEMLMNRISKGNVLPYIPRLLGVYPIVSGNQQLTEFVELWKNYGSVKQLQSAAYLYDAFNILADAIHNASLTTPNFTQIRQSCAALQEWQFGRIFQENLKKKSSNQRLTEGNLTYHYFSIDQFGFNKIATWTNGSIGINQISPIRWCTQQEFIQLRSCQGDSTLRCNKKIPPPRAPETSVYWFDYSQYTFDIVTIEREPFVNVTITEDGEEVFQGFCIDMMDKLSELMGFSYRISLVEDGKFGGQAEDGTWMGLVGDLVAHKAEIALAPLTITSNRERVIDFTTIYYNLGLQALYNMKDDGDQFNKSKLFTFLEPFDVKLWLLISASTIAVSIGVAIIGRLSPYDWHHSPPDDFSLWESRFQITLYNSVWQSLSAILQQGSETAPRSTSARILLGGWWFLCLVLIATFTANLAAIFATEDSKSNIPNTIDELISKIPPGIPFGAFNNTQTTEFLQLSPIPQYQEAFEYMRTEGFLFETQDEALTAVLHDNIAVITDSPYIDYFTSRKGPYNPDCTLVNIGDGYFSPVGYGLGLINNSPFTDDFSLAILELKARGEIENLITEYFTYRSTCTSEIAIASTSVNMDTNQIDLNSFGGLFILLGIGIIISLIVLLAEHTFKRRDSIRTMIMKRFYTKHQEEESITLPDSQEELRTSTEL